MNKKILNSLTKYKKLAFSSALSAIAIASFGFSPVVSAQTILFIDESQIAQEPQPDGTVAGKKGLAIYSAGDFKLTVKDTRLVSGSTCDFRIKAVEAADADATKGYDALTQSYLSSDTASASYNATAKAWRVPFANATAGANIKLAANKQGFIDYNLEVRCTSAGKIYGRDQKINFKFGAYSITAISAS
jgi:hypothetical protein